MKPHESPRINKKSIRGDSLPVWNRGIKYRIALDSKILCPFVSVHMRFLSIPHAVNACSVRSGLIRLRVLDM